MSWKQARRGMNSDSEFWAQSSKRTFAGAWTSCSQGLGLEQGAACHPPDPRWFFLLPGGGDSRLFGPMRLLFLIYAGSGFLISTRCHTQGNPAETLCYVLDVHRVHELSTICLPFWARTTIIIITTTIIISYTFSFMHAFYGQASSHTSWLKAFICNPTLQAPKRCCVESQKPSPPAFAPHRVHLILDKARNRVNKTSISPGPVQLLVEGAQEPVLRQLQSTGLPSQEHGQESPTCPVIHV